jgi:serine/threonine protein phosphatase PrpC
MLVPMAMADLVTAAVSLPAGERPRDDELDLFGLTHRGKVRKDNQDHFLLSTVHQQLVVHGTSIPEPERLPLRSQRLATVLLVADGVGGGTAGGEASRLAAYAVARYVASTMRCFHTAGTAQEEEFLDALQAAALEAHAAVREEATARAGASGDADLENMATTLTLAIAVWPWLYVVQVGDSRCYFFDEGTLRQVTRDQTIAQDLVDQGVLRPERAAASPFSRVLASAIGGGQAVPEVSRLDIHTRGCVVLLCSDGLTAHVTNTEIAEQIRSMESSEQLCRSLLDLALERGGTDNITVLAGRARGLRPTP